MSDISGSQWVRCPVCGSKTRLKIREDTLIYRLPLFCPKCRREIIVSIKKLKITTESDAS